MTVCIFFFFLIKQGTSLFIQYPHFWAPQWDIFSVPRSNEIFFLTLHQLCKVLSNLLFYSFLVFLILLKIFYRKNDMPLSYFKVYRLLRLFGLLHQIPQLFLGRHPYQSLYLPGPLWIVFFQACSIVTSSQTRSFLDRICVFLSGVVYNHLLSLAL